MAEFSVHWSNRLEHLAAGLFDQLYGRAWEDPMVPRCIVTNSPVMQAWLRHFFVFEWPKRHGRVMANCEFHLLYPFVNDWMDRLLIPGESASAAAKREPRHHPYSLSNLQWRIYRLLKEEAFSTAAFGPILAYLGEDPSPRRIFHLAGRLATLFDDCQVYRCTLLAEWEEDRTKGGWQGEMWRRLTRDRPDSYAALLRRMRDFAHPHLHQRFGAAYRQVAIFGTTSMPVAYMSFFNQVLTTLVDVDVYVLNPSREDWLDSVKKRVVDEAKEKLILEDCDLRDEPLLVPEQGHELLCSLGEGLQEYLHLLEGPGVSHEYFVDPAGDTVLEGLQRDMLARPQPAPGVVPFRSEDDSVRIHVCHGPRREVEVLHDYLLKWFTDEELQPYQVQVLVTDMDIYAPHIDAVFGTGARNAAATIPYVVDSRGSTADSTEFNSFRSLLGMVSSRFPVSSVVDLLRGEAVLAAFDLAPGDLDLIEQMLAAGNIRWGLDAKHRNQAARIENEGAEHGGMEPYMTWEYGLDRLLTGYALGTNTAHGDLLPVDHVEGESAVVLGKLARFVERLTHYREAFLAGAETAGEGRSLHQWHAVLTGLLDRFLVSANDTCRDIARIRRAIDDLKRVAKSTGLDRDPVPFDVVAAHLDAALSAMIPGDSLTANAVVFCALRPMNSRPSQAICVLGLNDGDFPRNDRRPTFDPLTVTRKRGDRSRRRDDRCAFLEAIVHARRRLFLSYVGRTDTENVVTPPSIVVQELRDHLALRHGLHETTGADGTRVLPFEIVHPLHAIDPRYFGLHPDPKMPLFSYSGSNLLAARQLVRRRDAEEPQPHGDQAGELAVEPACAPVELDSLSWFFLNPARHYYRNVLGVYLGVESSMLPDDDEPFAGSGLDGFFLREDIFEQLAGKDYEIDSLDVGEFTVFSKANGRVPLNAAGVESVKNALLKTHTWLGTDCGLAWADGATVESVLRKERSAEPHSAAVVVSPDGEQPVTVRGTLKRFELRRHPVQARARPANIQVKDLMKAWILHVFACAHSPGDDPPPRTLVVGLDRTVCYAPVPPGPARQTLTTLVSLYRRGHARPLQFAPETSRAYAETRRSLNERPASTLADERLSDASLERLALEASSVAWGYRSSFQRNECQDAWLHHAFGDLGPMRVPHREAFTSTAIAFFSPMLEALTPDPAAEEGSTP